MADFRVEWVEKHLGRTLTPFQASAVQLLCDAMRCGPYDFSSVWKRAEWGGGIDLTSFIIRGNLATFDSDGLTRLVIGSHDRMIRVDVQGCGPNLTRIRMWQRNRRVGGMTARAPTIEQAIRRYRDSAGAPPPWTPLTSPGQIADGDSLRFTLNGALVHSTAKRVLNAGTDREEVVYNLRKNRYFIVSMVLDGASNHTDVEFRTSYPLPGAPNG